MKSYTKEQFTDYVAGHMTVTDDGKNDIKTLKSALHNALSMLEDGQDGIEAGIEIKKMMKNEKIGKKR